MEKMDFVLKLHSPENNATGTKNQKGLYIIDGILSVFLLALSLLLLCDIFAIRDQDYKARIVYVGLTMVLELSIITVVQIIRPRWILLKEIQQNSGCYNRCKVVQILSSFLIVATTVESIYAILLSEQPTNEKIGDFLVLAISLIGIMLEFMKFKAYIATDKISCCPLKSKIHRIQSSYRILSNFSDSQTVP